MAAPPRLPRPSGGLASVVFSVEVFESASVTIKASAGSLSSLTTVPIVCQVAGATASTEPLPPQSPIKPPPTGNAGLTLP